MFILHDHQNEKTMIGIGGFLSRIFSRMLELKRCKLFNRNVISTDHNLKDAAGITKTDV